MTKLYFNRHYGGNKPLQSYALPNVGKKPHSNVLTTYDNEI